MIIIQNANLKMQNEKEKLKKNRGAVSSLYILTCHFDF